MSCTTASSGLRSRGASFIGVPTKCWCGKKVDLLVSKTNENPYKRFYRCKKNHESHIFKWVEVSMAEEFDKVGDRIEELVAEVKVISKEIKAMGISLSERVEKQKAAIEELEEGFRGSGVEASCQCSDGGFGWSIANLKKLALVVCFAGGLTTLYKKLCG
ncbi:hypothetical protein Bca52824_081424 [Brassica carinata]|uniref:GRF-type domain-containing protein n=2 Tax=Brassica TaxID=3705 RepID=A0A8X7PIN9_BRACI|nr:hypothetical protein Bca52824_081424 [Brassica carinata]VDD61067.1 unnamed protein product [Brassica oleracea]